MRIAIIGTGKVAWQLSQALFASGHHIQQIYGRRKSEAKKLATKVDATPIDNLDELQHTVELAVIAVTDDSIEIVATNIPRTFSGIVAHTSGATAMEVLSNSNTGVFYPLYSFPSKRKRSLKKVPFLISSNNKKIVQSLKSVADTISNSVYVVADEDRLKLHLAAVYANNFANFMMTKGFDICEKNDLNKAILLPIISQGAKKWKSGLSKDQQTGPAKRGDTKTMKKHQELISDSQSSELYTLISKHIQEYYA